MKITLKNLKVAEFASEETTCFSATVYLDGKRSFTARNAGHGGSHFMEPLGDYAKPSDRAKFIDAQNRLAAHAATLPPEDLGFLDGNGNPATYQPDIEWLINEALTDALHLKDMKRILKKVVGFKAGEPDDMRTWNVKANDYGIALVKSHNPGVKLLNEMSEADALAVWKEWIG